MSKKKGFGKFIAGAAIGTGIGMLFAPKKGSETRRDLKNKLDELANKVKGIDVDDVKEAIELKIEEIKKELSDLDKEKVLKIAKEKGKALKEKSQELVDLAVEKGTPVLQKAAEDTKKKTIEVLNATIKKLEGTPTKKSTKTTSKK